MKVLFIIFLALTLCSCADEPNEKSPKAHKSFFSEPIAKSSAQFKCSQNWLRQIENYYADDNALLRCVHEYAPMKLKLADIASIHWLPEDETYNSYSVAINIDKSTMIFLRVGYEVVAGVKHWTYFRVLAKHRTEVYKNIYYPQP